MLDPRTFELGKKYTFEIHGGNIIASRYENVTVLGVYDGLTAERLGYEVATKHANIYPLIKSEDLTVSEDFLSQHYIQIQHPNGNNEAIGLSWIKPNTVNRKSNTRITVKLENVSPDGEAALKDVLVSNGYIISSIQSETY